MARVYATPTQLAEWMGLGSPPAGADRMLRAASRDVDHLLVCAVYPVDGDGLPTEAAHVTALQEATCAQVEHHRSRGDPYGTGVSYIRQGSIGGVSFQRGTSGGGEVPGRYGQQTQDILQQVGLTGHEPQASS